MISLGPLALSAPDRGTTLQVRVSALAAGSSLPVVVFSHGYGWSADHARSSLNLLRESPGCSERARGSGVAGLTVPRITSATDGPLG